MSIDFTSLNKLTWYAWPDNIISYYKQQDVNGIGNGELCLKIMFNAQIMGAKKTFDLGLLNESGKIDRWEVKSGLFDKSNRRIRLGINGSIALAPMIDYMSKILNDLDTFVNTYKNLELHYWVDNDINNFIKELKLFIETFRSVFIVKGNLNKKLLNSLKYIIEKLVKINSKYEKFYKNVYHINDIIAINNLTFEQYAAIKQTLYQNELSTITDDDRFIVWLSSLTIPVLRGFQSFDDFYSKWLSLLEIKKAFQTIVGLFLVNEKGFFILPQENLKTYLSFASISNYRLQLSFTGNEPSNYLII